MRMTWVLMALSLLLAGCSDAPDDADGTESEETTTATETAEPEPTVVKIEVDAVGAYPVNPGFDPIQIDVVQGAQVELTFFNQEATPAISHDWYLEALDLATETIPPGESTNVTFTVDLEPGEYPYWCDIGDHRERGMEGVLVVTAA